MEKLFYKKLHFTTKVKELKPMGYTFQKLYARNYKTYRKEVECYTIWLWEKGKTIEIESWYSYTANVIDCYKNNLESWKEENSKLPRPRSAMTVIAHHNTGEVKLKDMDEYYKMMFGTDKDMDDYYKKYHGWIEIVLLIDEFNKVLEEVDLLTK